MLKMQTRTSTLCWTSTCWTTILCWMSTLCMLCWMSTLCSMSQSIACWNRQVQCSIYLQWKKRVEFDKLNTTVACTMLIQTWILADIWHHMYIDIVLLYLRDSRITQLTKISFGIFKLTGGQLVKAGTFAIEKFTCNWCWIFVVSVVFKVLR